MSCPSFELSARGRRGIGVVQPQSGLNYPFVAPSADIRYLVADFFLSYDDIGEYTAGNKIVPPLRIKYLYNVGCEENEPPANFLTPRCAQCADILVVDANNTVVFDSTLSETDASISEWGSDYRIYSWRQNSRVCNLVAYTTWAETDDDKKHYAKYLAPINAELDGRATYKIPKRLRTLSVKNGATVVATDIIGDVFFRNGYNTTIDRLETQNNNFRVNTALVFAAEAGTGTGKYQNCDPDSDAQTIRPIQRINGIDNKKGDFLISAADCLFARRPTTQTGGAIAPAAVVQQQIGADCPPCCSCSDYVDTALYLNQVQSQYVLIGSRVNDVKLYHEQNVARWQDQRLCSTNPLKLLLVPQRCPYMDIVLMLCNPCQTCIPASKLTLTLTPAIYSPATLVCGYTAMYASGINGRPIPVTETQNPDNSLFSAQFPVLRGGGSAYLKFRVEFEAKSQYVINGVLTAELNENNNPILTGCDDTPAEDRDVAIAIRSETLYCTPEGQTDKPC